MKFLATTAIVMATATAAHGQSVTIFQSGFEPADGYTLGNLNGQNGWLTFLGESPSLGQVSNSGALSGAQSIVLDGHHVGLGTYGNYAAVGLSAVVAPTRQGVPLRYLEVTGRSKIVDPTLSLAHSSSGNFTFYNAEDFVTGAGCSSASAQLVFGWSKPEALPVQAGVAFEFRHVADYQTGFASLWMDGRLVFENFTTGFDAAFTPTDFYFELASGDLLPFDTRVWFDDMHIKAIYGCSADTNRDAEVNVDDLIAVILAWGSCPKSGSACAADINGDGQINVDDLVAVILGWGGC